MHSAKKEEWEAIDGSPSDRRSISSYRVMTRGNLVYWKSKKKDVVARLSGEAKYQAIALATCELIWLKHLLQELRFGNINQMHLICDNQAALHIASNPMFHKDQAYRSRLSVHPRKDSIWMHCNSLRQFQ